MKHHGGKAIPDQPAKAEKAENGLVEEAGKTIREYACTFISQIEEGIREVLEAGSPIFFWVIRWGGHLLLEVHSWSRWTHRL